MVSSQICCGIFSGVVVRYFETDRAKWIREPATKDYLRNLSSVGTYPRLKGQVILRCLTNLSESFGEVREMRPKICFSDWTLPRTRGRREEVKLWGKGGATFNARTIKVEEIRNQQRMLPYGFLVRIEFEVISRLHNSWRGGKIGIIILRDCVDLVLCSIAQLMVISFFNKDRH